MCSLSFRYGVLPSSLQPGGGKEGANKESKSKSQDKASSKGASRESESEAKVMEEVVK